MKSFEKLKRVLSELEISSEQEDALNDFFEELTESIEDRVSSNYLEEISEKDSEIEALREELENNQSIINESDEEMIPVSQAERAFELFKRDAESAFEMFEADFTRDAEKAFDLFESKAEAAFNKLANDSEQAFLMFESDVEKAFEMFEEDASAATELMREDLQNVYAEKSMKAIEELYESIESEVKEAFKESEEWRTLNDIKEKMTPFVLEESEDELAKKIVNLSTEKETLFEEVETLKKKELIKSLVSDFPDKEASIIQEFIEKGKDENEIYERFSSIIEILETKINNNEEIERDDFILEERRSYRETERNWKKPSNKRVFSEFLESEGKKSKVKREKKNIISKPKTKTRKPFFESKSFENKETRKKEFLMQPYEEKIIEQVFGN